MKRGILGLLLVILALGACQKKDIYDPNYNPDLGVSVPDDFDWSTTQTLKVNVAVNDEYNGKYYYSVRIYYKEPKDDGVAPVAASARVNKNLPFSQEIVIPATVSKLYISQVFKKADSSEIIVTKEVPIDGTVVNYVFEKAKSRNLAARSKDNNKDIIELTTGMTIEGKKHYSVNGEYTISQIDEEVKDVTIEVYGTLNFTSSVTMSNKWVIDIKDGGKLTANQNTTLVFPANTELLNYGEVDIYNVIFENGATWYNGDAMTGRNEGACFTANQITLEGGHGSDKRTLGERSYTSCNILVLNNVKLMMKTSAWLKCGRLQTAHEKGGAATLQGGSTVESSNYVALAMIGEIAGHLTIEDNILVECSNITGSITGEVVPDASGLITIVGTVCSDGGFNNEEKSELGSYTYIIEDMYPEQGDYDMNDIVVVLTASQTGRTLEILAQLKAVGATRKITPYVKVGDDVRFFMGEGTEQEAHDILAGKGTTYSPINTQRNGPSYSSRSTYLQFNNVKEGLNQDDIDFYIVVGGKTEIHWNTREGKKVWGMRVPGSGFKWPQEGIKITQVYPLFSKWFEDSSYPWYTSYDSSKIY